MYLREECKKGNEGRKEIRVSSSQKRSTKDSRPPITSSSPAGPYTYRWHVSISATGLAE